MEQRIILTDEEIKILEKDRRGELNPFFMEDREREVIDKIIDNARALMKKLDAYDELGNSLVEWYYNKFKAQQ